MRAKLTDAEMVEQICIALKLRGPASPSQVSTYLREHRETPNKYTRVNDLMVSMAGHGMVAPCEIKGTRNGYSLSHTAIPPGAFGTPVPEPAAEETPEPGPVHPLTFDQMGSLLLRMADRLDKMNDLLAGIYRQGRERTPLLPLDRPTVGANGR